MQAVLMHHSGGPEVLYLGETDSPEISDHEILIQVAATALNRADTLQREGKYPPPPGESEIIGLEAAGTVIKIGKGVNKWKIGDKVCCLLGGGGYASLVKVDARHAMPIVGNLSINEAVAIPEVFLTAYQALFTLANLKADDKVLIHAGASGVGTAAIQLAKLIGAEVYVTASAPKHELCYALGAKHAIDYKTQTFDEEIQKLTNNKGVNVIIDFMGASYLNKNLDALAPDGKLVLLALMGGALANNINIGKILMKRIQIMGSTLRARSADYKAELIAGFTTAFLSKFATGELKPIIDSKMSWHNVVEAHKRMDANLNAGKIVLYLD